MEKLLSIGLNTAKQMKVTYADLRILNRRSQDIRLKNSKLLGIKESFNVGFGVRVLYNGAWGFSASNDLTAKNIKKVTADAVKTAKASSCYKNRNVILAKKGIYQDVWKSPCKINPFEVEINKKVDLLLAIDKILRKDKRIKISSANMEFAQTTKWYADTEGSIIKQEFINSGCGYSATAVDAHNTQIRSYPNSHNGQIIQAGYEAIEDLKLLENAERVREEAIALLSAKECPAGIKDIIIDGSQLALQIHESCGHPSELDRVLGMEANFAGRSFLTTEKYRKFKYGSKIVNLIADSTIPTGIATQAYDDDGVKAQKWYIVKNGIFKGYHTNRELCKIIGEKRSKGANRADNWNSIPMIRISNLSLMPGKWKLSDMIKDTKEGIYFETNKSWSIDQLRLNFQFSTEIAWEIKNGKLRKMLKNPIYQSRTPEFWGSCDAIADKNSWRLWGLSNCGKGEPMQVIGMSHGASPARFRKINVGVNK